MRERRLKERQNNAKNHSVETNAISMKQSKSIQKMSYDLFLYEMIQIAKQEEIILLDSKEENHHKEKR